MFSIRNLGIAATAAFSLATAASAAVTTVDFTAMTPGLITSFTGATVALSGGPTASTVANVGYVFGNYPGNPVSLNNGTFYSATLADYPTAENLVISFNAPVRNISFTFANYGSGNGSFVRTLDGMGNLLSQTTIDNLSNFATVSLTDSGVKTLIISNNSGGESSWQFGVGQISFAAVPEPQSWALLIAGFGLVGAAARRRTAIAA